MADRQMLDALAQMLASSGITVDDLAAHMAGTGTGKTVAAFHRAGLAAMTEPSRAKHKGYIDVLVDGLPGMCWCLCDRCVTHRETGSRTYTCPCDGGDCTCRNQKGWKFDYAGPAPVLELVTDPRGGIRVEASVADEPGCSARLVGLGPVQLADVTTDDLQVMAQWVRRRAAARWRRRNIQRAAAGRPQYGYDGRGAVEGWVTATRAWFAAAVNKRHRADNPAADLDKPRRNRQGARAIEIGRLSELWDAIFESGSDDADLDVMLIWFHLETGARRGGAINLRVGHLHDTAVELTEKFGDRRIQPVSPELAAALAGFARSRGVVEGLLPSDAPIFYYKTLHDKDGHPGPPRPLTTRRYDNLIERLRLHLPWADQLFLRPHDLRKSVGAFIERAYGHAVARAYLGHAPADVTGSYIAASDEEVRRAHRGYTGTMLSGPVGQHS